MIYDNIEADDVIGYLAKQVIKEDEGEGKVLSETVIYRPTLPSPKEILSSSPLILAKTARILEVTKKEETPINLTPHINLPTNLQISHIVCLLFSLILFQLYFRLLNLIQNPVHSPLVSLAENQATHHHRYLQAYHLHNL
jgi:hypothetical protein